MDQHVIWNARAMNADREYESLTVHATNSLNYYHQLQALDHKWVYDIYVPDTLQPC